MLRSGSLIATLAIMLVVAPACSNVEPSEEVIREFIGTWPVGLRKCLNLGEGRSTWRWVGGENAGDAQLVLSGQQYRWTLDSPPPPVRIQLQPTSGSWLSLALPHPDELAVTPPLPSLPCDSEAFSDLVDLLRTLITPRFEGRVVHWPERPIPVRAPPAISGGLDLAACLREAVTIWNQDAPPFVWDDDATWGVRLAHYAGSSRSPTMQLQITRRDAAGRPLRARIAVGDDYDIDEKIFAVRAMAHELAHATLLWGHSPDRRHLLWGDAPPLRATPSEDERRAVALLHALPEGLDLNRYGRANEPGR